MVDLPTVCWVIGPEVELVAITTGGLILLRFQELILTLEDINHINQVVKTALHVSGLGPTPAVINQDSAVHACSSSATSSSSRTPRTP